MPGSDFMNCWRNEQKKKRKEKPIKNVKAT